MNLRQCRPVSARNDETGSDENEPFTYIRQPLPLTWSFRRSYTLHLLFARHEVRSTMATFRGCIRTWTTARSVVGWNLFVEVICCTNIENECQVDEASVLFIWTQNLTVFALLRLFPRTHFTNVDDTLGEEEIYISTSWFHLSNPCPSSITLLLTPQQIK